MEWSRQFRVAALLVVMLFIAPTFAQAKIGTLIPMGHSISIQMDLKGVFVTNDFIVDEQLWLKTGDTIEQINAQQINTIHDFEQTVKSLRNEKELTLAIVQSKKPQTIQISSEKVKGLLPFLKDRTEGTGTLTYVDPRLGTYGALGHQIIDSSLKAPPLFKNGAIFLSEIDQIKKSSPGVPGYKISSIVNDQTFMGTIRTNGVYGIFGAWNNAYEKVLTEPLEIMQPTELKTGKAEIRTTVNGSKVETFSIDITKIEENQFNFLLTDSKLLQTTGGILQGMSGSPVLQNGKFVGAVTHMFVDEPKKGAGIFIVQMKSGEQ